jgi:CRISPR-associated protein (TIGR03986 family)
LKLVPARAEIQPDGSWSLKLLTGDVAVHSWDERPSQLYAVGVRMYDPIKLAGRGGRPPREATGAKRFQHGHECFAAVTRRKFPPAWRAIEVRDANENDAEAQLQALIETERARDEQWVREKGGKPAEFEVVRGWLCVNNQNIEVKHSERLFFVKKPKGARHADRVTLPDAVQQRYTELLRDYQSRHENEIRNWKPEERRKRLKRKGDAKRWQDWEAAPSRFIHRNVEPALQHGDLVYARLTGPVDNPKVMYIVPVSVPRLGYEARVEDRLPGAHMAKCKDANQLCPACRTFGWVYGRPGVPDSPRDDEIPTAYASRVRFSVGEPIGQPPTMGDMTLAILSSPKPTTVRFYLRPKQGRPEDGRDDVLINYDAQGMVLRGRKLYRYQPSPQPGEYIRPPKDNKTGRDDQNRTVHDALEPGARFQFRVQFENLAAAELGALLWSLDFGGREMFHRLGFGKPLGFGSLTAEVTGVRLMQPERRYAGLDDAGWEPALDKPAIDGAMARERWVNPFEDALWRAHRREGNDFESLPNVADLVALLSKPANSLPIHYPRSTQEPDPQGKNFQWFMENNHKARGRKLVLPLAPDDSAGFPLSPMREQEPRKDRPKPRGSRPR